VVWFLIIGFAIMMYVLLDGFVLGIGILSPFADDEPQQELMMNTAAPIWDGNETWLVMGGAGLMGAFPKAYALILPALYVPVLALLIALIFRGVAFEFRFRAERSRRIWGLAFCLGSVVAAFTQGVILGAIVEGIPLQAGQAVHGTFDWYAPFPMLTGVALIFGYGLLGATWLVLKTEGRAQLVARELARPLMLVVIAFMGLVSASLPFLDSRLMARWFSWPNMAYLAPLPIATLVVAVLLWRSVMKNRDARPFVLALAFFALGFLGLVVGMWPNLVPPSLSIWDAASPPSSQGFVLVGAAIMLPVVVLYTAYSYRVFRGKVRAGEGYH
jgi:cytochrome d ubiquinol oxidase subunit II